MMVIIYAEATAFWVDSICSGGRGDMQQLPVHRKGGLKSSGFSVTTEKGK